ncbi:MAG: hypothetical protein WED10_12205 [Brumimicrobium sp.]
MNYLILSFLFCISIQFELLSQESQSFKINISSSFIDYQMKEFNDRINDPKYIDTNYYKELLPISLSEGFNFEMTVSYRPFQYISLGVYGGYQFGKTERDIRIIQHQYDIYTPNDTTRGKRIYEVQSLNIGLNASLILSQMNFWSKKTSLSNIECAININTGYGWAYLFKDDVFDGFVPNSSKEVYRSKGFQFVSTIQLGYILSNNNYFSSIGLKAGYQHYITSDAQAENGLLFPNGDKTRLDFSGFTVGAYLSIGR